MIRGDYDWMDRNEDNLRLLLNLVPREATDRPDMDRFSRVVLKKYCLRCFSRSCDKYIADDNDREKQNNKFNRSPFRIVIRENFLSLDSVKHHEREFLI